MQLVTEIVADWNLRETMWKTFAGVVNELVWRTADVICNNEVVGLKYWSCR